MAKQKKLHEPFESSNPNGKFYKITENMRKSKAWQELNLIDRALYLEFKFKFTKYRDGTDNRNNISMPKSEYSTFMNERTFSKTIDKIIEMGFVRVIECRWNTRECTIYGLSEQWANYGTDNFTITIKDRRIKRKMSEEHRNNVVKALELTNRNKSVK